MQHKPMLAESFRALKAGPWVAEPKLDGMRGLWDGRTLWTRGSEKRPPRPVVNPPEVLAELHARFSDCVLDGELYGIRWGETASVCRTTTSTKHSKDIRFHVFDVLATGGMNLCGQTYDKRREILDDLFLAGDTEAVVWLPFRPLAGRDPVEVARAFVAQGYEGAMLKQLNSPYLCGIRSPMWLKVKFTDEVDAMIVGAELGEGKFSRTLGALSVVAGDGTPFRVGGGFTDRQRAALWAQHLAGTLAGQIVTVEYQPGDENIRARFPRFKRMRVDL
jgi:DNA ligase-1